MNLKARQIAGLLVCIGAMVAMAAAAQAAGFEVAVGGWHQDPGGRFSYKAIEVGDTLDVGRDLRYDSENRIHGRAKIELPRGLPTIYLMASPALFEGIGRKAVTFRFGDREFDAGADFFSRLKIDQYDVGLYYGLPCIRTATLQKLNIDIGINVRIFDLEGRIRQEDTGISQSESITLALPQLYLAFQLTPVKGLALEGEGRGLTIGGNAVYSLIGRLRINAFGPVFVAGGYRYDHIDVSEDDLVVDLTLQGPFVEVGFRF